MQLPWMGRLDKMRSMNTRQKTEREPCSGNVCGTRSTGGPGKTPTRVLQPAPTIRLRPEQAEALPRNRQVQPAETVAHFGTSDTGLVRDHNEDAFFFSSLGTTSLYAVADGMGGHDAGEVASRIAMDTVCGVIREECSAEADLLNLVERAVQQANRAVQQEALMKGSDMGTTISVALVSDHTAYVANVGDSRVYWIENGFINQITTDHSLVAKLAAAGKLTKEEARTHPKANLLYRTIGSAGRVPVDTFRVPLAKGGTLLLCTDGLWGEVTDSDIHRICVSEKDARAAGIKLTRMANENGGKDNITVVIAKIV
ncbi:MAG TPA: Stp1/IreP family PP2C-type Ser/Thr phosphatase [Nitrospirota bacterium]|nr:Stp1/IreP family PP2C-type Ser/Thr phosphatase [Nitrospirota bacterium]